MDERALEAELRKEGFGHIYIWQDRPNAIHPDHIHAEETTHVILDGEMMLAMGGKSKTYRMGERFDVPAGEMHSAKIGPAGCRYLVALR